MPQCPRRLRSLSHTFPRHGAPPNQDCHRQRQQTLPRIRLSEIWCWEFFTSRTVTGSTPSPSRTASASPPPPRPKHTASNPAASAPLRRRARSLQFRVTIYYSSAYREVSLLPVGRSILMKDGKS